MKPEEIRKESSVLENAIKSRKRKMFECEITDTLGCTFNILGKLLMRIPTAAEQQNALIAYAKYVETKTKEVPSLANDTDFTFNAKNAHILFSVCFQEQVIEGGGIVYLPAFPSADWMMQNLGIFELGELLNQYNECFRVSSNSKSSRITSDYLKDLAKYCFDNSSSRAPNQFVSKLGYDEMSEALIMMSIMYHSADSAHVDLAESISKEKTDLLDNLIAIE